MRKLKLSWSLIHLLASVSSLIAAIIYLFKGDVLIFNTEMILALLFLRIYNDSVKQKSITDISRDDSGNLVATTNGKDLELIIKRNIKRNN